MVIYSSREEKGRGACTSSRDVIFVSLSRHRIRPSHNEIIWRRRRRRQIAFCDDSRHYIYQISVVIKKLDRRESTAAEREGGKEQSRVGFSSPISLCRVVQGKTGRRFSIYDVSTVGAEPYISGQIVCRFCGHTGMWL